MYIVKMGEVTKSINQNQSQNDNKLGVGMYFGQYTMLEKNCKWHETITANQECEIIALGVEDVENALGRSLPLIIIRNKAK